jgi:Condensation domain
MADDLDLSGRRARLTPAQRALLEKRLHGGGVPAPEDEWTIVPGAPSGPAPASFAQRRLWHFAAESPGALAYNVYYAIGLRGPLKAATLARSVRAVAARHAALHTRFVAAGGEILAIATPELLPAWLPRVDLSGLPDAMTREATGLRVVAAELASPGFDLEAGPLLRAALVLATPGEHSLLLAVHHVIIDGWSLALLTRDLAAAYEVFAAGGVPEWPDTPLQSADFSRWQLRRVREGALAGDLSWWRAHLASAPPRGLTWPARPGARGGHCGLHLGAALTRDLKSLAQRERVTLFIALLAALAALLHQWTGETDLIVGTPVAVRGRPEAAGILGFLLNLLPLRTDLAQDPTFLELLHRVRDSFLGALAHSEAPFEWLAEELLPDWPRGETPWIRVLFNMPSGDAGHAEPLRAGGVEIEPLLTGEMGSEFDWTFYARELAGGVRLDLGFNANLLAPDEPARLLAGFADLLGEAIADPGQRLSKLGEVFATPVGMEV